MIPATLVSCVDTVDVSFSVLGDDIHDILTCVSHGAQDRFLTAVIIIGQCPARHTS